VAELSRPVRLVAAFITNCLLACLGPQVLTRPFERAFRPANLFHVVLASTVFGFLAAFVLAWLFCMSRKRWAVTAEWVWVAGLAWFLYGSMQVYWGQDSTSILQRHSLYSEMSGFSCGSDIQSCRTWAMFTLQFVRTMGYSAGAAFYGKRSRLTSIRQPVRE
jgi:hypothetical protein